MSRKTVFVDMSGDLIGNLGVIEWFRPIARQSFTVVCVGGGTQISKAFEDKGFPTKFGSLGRITETLEQRELARYVLVQNQMLMQDLFAENGIMTTVIIPVLEIESVLCHINGDVFVLLATGFNEIYRLTLKERVETKEEQFKNYPKIQIVGF